MADINITAAVSEFDVSAIESGARKLQNSLGNLKLPPKLKTEFESAFKGLYNSVDEIQKKMQTGFKTKGDVTGLSKSADSMVKEYEGILKLVEQLNAEGIDIKIDPNDPKLKGFEQQIDNLKKKIGDLGDGDEVQGLINSLNELGKTSKSNAVTQLVDSFQKMDFSKAREQLEAAGQAIDNFAKGNEDLDQFKQKFKEVFSEGAETSKESLEALKVELNSIGDDGTKGLKAFATQMITAFEAYQSKGVQAVEEVNVEIQNTTRAAEEYIDTLAESGRQDFSNNVKNFEDMRDSVNKTNEVLKDTAQSQYNLNSQVDQLKSRVAHFVSLSNAVNLFKRALKSAFKTVQDLDKAMTETAVVTDFSVGDMWDKLPEYTKIANQYGASVQDAYEVMTIFYQQGLETNQVFEVGQQTMQMARIAGLDYAEAADRMTNALRAFNMEINKTNAANVNDVYSALAASSASNVDELSTAMTKVASLASSANMSFENTSAFLAQMIETTRESAETAGTALKTVVARFAEVKKLYSKGELLGTDENGESVDVNKVGTALRAVGIDLNEFMTGAKGLDQILLELSAKWDTLDITTQRYIATMAAGSRQQSRFLALMSDNSRLTELAGIAENSQGASASQFEKTQESLESKLNRLKNAWNEFLMNIESSSVIKKGVDALTSILNVVNKLTGSFGNLGSSIANLAIAFGTIKLAGKGLEKGLGYLGNTIAAPMLRNVGEMTGNKTLSGVSATSTKSKQGLMPWMINKAENRRQQLEGIADKEDKTGGFKTIGRGIKSKYNTFMYGNTPQSIKYKIDVDSKEGKAKLKAFVESETGKKIKTEIESDTLKAENEIEAFKLKHENEDIDLDLELNQEKALGQSEAFEAAMSGDPIDKKVEIDIKKAELELEAFEKKAELEGIDLKVNPEYNALQSDLAKKRARYEGQQQGLQKAGKALESEGLASLNPVSLKQSFSALGTQIEGMIAPILSIAPAILAIAAAVAAIAVTAYVIYEQVHRNENALATVSKGASQLKESFQQASDNLNELQSSWDELVNSSDELQDLTAGTAEWYAKIAEINSKVVELIQNLQNLGHTDIEVTVDENGLMSIDKNSYVEAMEKQSQKLIELQATSIYISSQKTLAEQSEEIRKEQKENKKNLYESNAQQYVNNEELYASQIKAQNEAGYAAVKNAMKVQYKDQYEDAFYSIAAGRTSGDAATEVADQILVKKMDEIASRPENDTIDFWGGKVHRDFEKGDTLLEQWAKDFGYHWNGKELEDSKGNKINYKDRSDEILMYAASKELKNDQQKILETSQKVFGKQLYEIDKNGTKKYNNKGIVAELLAGNFDVDLSQLEGADLSFLAGLSEEEYKNLGSENGNLLELLQLIGDNAKAANQAQADLKKTTLEKLYSDGSGIETESFKEISKWVAELDGAKLKTFTDQLQQIQDLGNDTILNAYLENIDEYQKDISQLDFSNAIMAYDSLKKLGVLDSLPSFSEQLQSLFTSGAWDDLSESVKELVEADGAITPDNLKALSRESNTLDKLLDNNTESINGIVNALNLVNNGVIGFDELTDSVIGALNNVKTLQQALTEVSSFVANFSAGADYKEGTKFFGDAAETLQENIENKTYGQSQAYLSSVFAGFQSLSNSMVQQYANELSYWQQDGGKTLWDGIGLNKDIAKEKGNTKQLADWIKERILEVYNYEVTDTYAESQALAFLDTDAGLLSEYKRRETKDALQGVVNDWDTHISPDAILSQEELNTLSKALGISLEEMKTYIEQFNKDANTKIKIQEEFTYEDENGQTQNLSEEERRSVYLYGGEQHGKNYDSRRVFESGAESELFEKGDDGETRINYSKALKKLQELKYTQEEIDQFFDDWSTEGQDNFVDTVKIWNNDEQEWTNQQITGENKDELDAKREALINEQNYAKMAEQFVKAFSDVKIEIKAENSQKIETLLENVKSSQQEINSTETTISINGNQIDLANTALGTLKNSLNDIAATSISIKANVTTTTTAEEEQARGTPGSHRFIQSGTEFNRYRSGRNGARKNEIALVGEEGPELIQRENGGAYLAGEHGPEMTRLEKGDIVFSHPQTNKIFNGISSSKKDYFNRYNIGTGQNFLTKKQYYDLIGYYPKEKKFQDTVLASHLGIESGKDLSDGSVTVYEQPPGNVKFPLYNEQNAYLVSIGAEIEETSFGTKYLAVDKITTWGNGGAVYPKYVDEHIWNSINAPIEDLNGHQVKRSGNYLFIKDPSTPNTEPNPEQKDPSGINDLIRSSSQPNNPVQEQKTENQKIPSKEDEANPPSNSTDDSLEIGDEVLIEGNKVKLTEENFNKDNGTVENNGNTYRITKDSNGAWVGTKQDKRGAPTTTTTGNGSTSTSGSDDDKTSEVMSALEKGGALTAPLRIALLEKEILDIKKENDMLTESEKALLDTLDGLKEGFSSVTDSLEEFDKNGGVFGTLKDSFDDLSSPVSEFIKTIESGEKPLGDAVKDLLKARPDLSKITKDLAEGKKNLKDFVDAVKQGGSGVKDLGESVKNGTFNPFEGWDFSKITPQSMIKSLFNPIDTDTLSDDEKTTYENGQKIHELRQKQVSAAGEIVDQGVTWTNDIINGVGKVSQAILQMMQALAQAAIDGFNSYLKWLTIKIDDEHDIQELDTALKNRKDLLQWEFGKLAEKNFNYDDLKNANAQANLFENLDDNAQNILLRLQNQRRLYGNSFRQLEDLGTNINSDITSAINDLYDQLYGNDGVFTKLNDKIEYLEARFEHATKKNLTQIREFDLVDGVSDFFEKIGFKGGLFSNVSDALDPLNAFDGSFAKKFFQKSLEAIAETELTEYRLGNVGESLLQRIGNFFFELSPKFDADYQIVNKSELADALKQKMDTIITNDTITSQFVNTYLDYLTEIESQMESEVGNIRAAESEMLSLYDEMTEILDKGKEEYTSLEQAIYQAIVNEKDKLREELEALNKNITDADKDIVTILKDNLQQIRQERENNKTEETLSEKERRLAYLKQDTTGANLQEILKLQKELEDGQESYTDKLIDQKVSELEKQNDKAAQQRQTQIDLLQQETQNTKLIWEKVRVMMDDISGYNGWDDLLKGEIKRDAYQAIMDQLKKGQDYKDASDEARARSEEEWGVMIRNASVYGAMLKDEYRQMYTGLGAVKDLLDHDTKLASDRAEDSGWHDYVAFTNLETAVKDSTQAIRDAVSVINNIVDARTISFDEMGSTFKKMTQSGAAIQSLSGLEYAMNKTAEDLSSGLPGILTQITTAVGNLSKGAFQGAGAIMDTAKGYIEGGTALAELGEAAGMVIEGVSNLFAAGCDGAALMCQIIGDTAPGFTDMGVAAGTLISNWLDNAYEEVDDKLKDNVEALLTEMYGEIDQSGLRVGGNFNFMGETIAAQKAALTEYLTNNNSANNSQKSIRDFVDSIYDGVEKEYSDINDVIQNMIERNDIEGINKQYSRFLALEKILQNIGHTESVGTLNSNSINNLQEWAGERGSIFAEFSDRERKLVVSAINEAIKPIIEQEKDHDGKSKLRIWESALKFQEKDIKYFNDVYKEFLDNSDYSVDAIDEAIVALNRVFYDPHENEYTNPSAQLLIEKLKTVEYKRANQMIQQETSIWDTFLDKAKDAWGNIGSSVLSAFDTLQSIGSTIADKIQQIIDKLFGRDGKSSTYGSYATGGTISRRQTALVGEAGAELIQHANGGATLATGPTMANLKKGDIIYNAAQTRKMFKNGGIDFSRFAEGTVGALANRDLPIIGMSGLVGLGTITGPSENAKENVFNFNLSLEGLTVDSVDRVDEVADRVWNKITTGVSNAMWPFNRL